MKKKSFNKHSTWKTDIESDEGELNVVDGLVFDKVILKLQTVLFRNKDIKKSAWLVKGVLNGTQGH